MVTCSLLSVLIGSSSSQGNPNPEPTNSLVDSDLEAALPSAAVTPLSEPPLVISQLRGPNGESISSETYSLPSNWCFSKLSQTTVYGNVYGYGYGPSEFGHLSCMKGLLLFRQKSYAASSSLSIFCSCGVR